MEFSLADQTIYFLFSLLFGAALSILYDCVRILRISGFNKLWQIVLSDVLYFSLCGFLTVLFALPFNNGGVRYFVVFGEAVGFIVYRFTLGELMGKVYTFLITIFSKILKKTLKYVLVFLNKLLKAYRIVVYNVCVVINKIQNIVFGKRKFYEHKKRIK